MTRSWFSRPRKSVQIDDLVKIKGVSHCLGKGVSGTVWKVVDKSVQEVMALKVDILRTPSRLVVASGQAKPGVMICSM